MDSASGAHVQRYELIECIARGGMGEVFRAQAYGAHGFRKDVAIKRILPGLGGHKEFEQRFISEANLAVTLTHANIVQVLDFGHDGDALFIAMEFVDGCDLRSLVTEHRLSGIPIPLGAVMHIAISACNGLDFAHQRGVLHRDVSPANLLLSRAGEVKIADFGLAKAQEGGLNLTAARQIFGKAPYMSPEQTLGKRLDKRSDIFSLGVIIHELITGRQLFSASRPDKILVAVNESEIPPPSAARSELPAVFDDVVLRALQRDREARFPGCGEMARALTEACYATGLVHTPQDVADLVAELTPQPEVKPKTAATAAELGFDPEKTQTFIRTETTAEGLARFERTAESPRAPPAPGDSIPPRDRRLIAAVVLAAAAGLGVVVGFVAMSWNESEPTASVAADAAAQASDASRPDARSAPIPTTLDAAIRTVDAAPPPEPDSAPPPAVDAAVIGVDARPASSDGPRFGTIAINVDPWAHVYFRGKKKGTTPIAKLRLPVGTHRLRLVNPALGREKTVRVKVPSKRAYSFSL